jgi:hypothetical protein
MGRSNKELRAKGASRASGGERETELGSGLLENARRGLRGRTRSIDEALDEAEGTPKKKRKSKDEDEE